MIDRNHPAVEAAHFASLGKSTVSGQTWADALTAVLEHLTADDLPARLVRDIQARTIRSAARAATYEEDGIPWDHDWDRATVSAWLDGLADNIEGGTE